MTDVPVNNVLPLVTVTAAGGQTVFSYPFLVQTSAQLSVIETTDPTGTPVEKTLVEGTDYSILGVGEATGGTITLDPTEYPTGATAGTLYTLSRATPIERTTDFPFRGNFSAGAINTELDTLTIVQQELERDIQRAVTLPINDPLSSAELPLQALRANKAFHFDSSGAPLMVTPTDASGTVVTADGSTAARALAERFSDWINVKDHDAIGDGVTDDAPKIAAAVAAAAAAGSELYWPNGTYLTASSIANLHTVRHRGPGIIKRGTDLFAVEPQDSNTNVIYIAASGGLDTNDGLSSSEPFATVQAALDIVTNYGGVLRGTWRFDLAAGTYTEDGIQIQELTYSNNAVQIQGPDVSGGVPTAIISGSGGSANGLIFNRKIEAQVKDIKFTTFGTTRDAVIISQMSDVRTINVHVDGAQRGVLVDELSKARIEGGIIDNCDDEGINVVNANATIGLSGGFLGPTIQSCARGVGAKEASDVRVDDTTIQDCTIGIRAEEQTRIGLNGTVNLKRNTTALQTEESGIIEFGGTINYNDNSVDSNTVNFKAFGFGVRADEVRSPDGVAFRPRFIDSDTHNHTGDTLETTLKTFTDAIRSNTFVFKGKTLNVKLITERSGTAGAATVRLKLGGTLFASFTVPATPAGPGWAEAKFIHKGIDQANTQDVSVFFIDSGGNIEVSRNNRTLTLDDTAGDLDLTVTVQLVNGADTVGTRLIEVYETG